MNFKKILKGMNLLLLSSYAYSTGLKGDCKDIETYLIGKNMDYSNVILDCEVNNSGNVTILKITNYDSLSKDDINILLSYKTIKELYYGVFSSDNNVGFPVEISNLPNLEELGLSYSGLGNSTNGRIEKNTLKAKTLKKLIIGGVNLSQTNIDEISSLSNLENLNLVYCSYNNLNYNSLTNLNKLTTLEMNGNNNNHLNEIPSFVYSLLNLKNLIITGHTISTISEKLANIKMLEYLDLSSNEINSVLPESLNTLSNLKYIDLRHNKDVKGKTLTNQSLLNCYYNKSYSLCKAKDMSCFEPNVIFASCSSEKIKTISRKTETVNKEGRCGEGVGLCVAGKCCSKYGWCGIGDSYCNISKGCQSEFGQCSNSIAKITIKKTITKKNTKYSKSTHTNNQCGKKYGSCPSGECCSKHGWCGTTDKYCGSGCQSEFGECN